MPLFERGYKAAAVAELERSVRELEERNKVAQTKSAFLKEGASVESNLNFAERLNLISLTQADALRERLFKAHIEFERLQKTETRDIVDDFENPRERSARYQSMDNYNAQIAQERAKVNAEKTGEGQSCSMYYEIDERLR